MITVYIREKNGNLKGCVVQLDNGRIGYSLCHPNDKKKLTKKMTRTIAIGRAEKRDLEDGAPVWDQKRGIYTNPEFQSVRGDHAVAVPHSVAKAIKELLAANATRQEKKENPPLAGQTGRT